MDLYEKLGINAGDSVAERLEQLEQKQLEYLERLDRVEDEKRRTQLEAELKEVEAEIASLSELMHRAKSGIILDMGGTDSEPENYDALKSAPTVQENAQPLQARSVQQSTQSQKTEEELFDEALALIATPDYEKGLELMQKLAEEGNFFAQKDLAKRYAEGNRVVRDESIAAKLCEMAAEQGDAKAQSNLGNLYYVGHGVMQNYRLAAHWYEKAAEQGNGIAQFNLGYMYHMGHGIPRNYRLAVHWYEKAAGQGYANAEYNLGHMYEEGQGVEKNEQLAIALYKEAAAQGQKNAIDNLKRRGIYRRGIYI